MILCALGKQADWTIAGSAETSGAFNTYTKYTYKNGTDSDTSDDIIVYAKNIEGIDFDDIYVSASSTAVTTEVDEDGDGKEIKLSLQELLVMKLTQLLHVGTTKQQQGCQTRRP